MILLALALACGDGQQPPPPRDAAQVLDEAERAPLLPYLGTWTVHPPVGAEPVIDALAGEGDHPVARWLAAHPDHPEGTKLREAAAALADTRIEIASDAWTVHAGDTVTRRRWQLEADQLAPSGVRRISLALLDAPGNTVDKVHLDLVADDRIEILHGVGPNSQTLVLARSAVPRGVEGDPP